MTQPDFEASQFRRRATDVAQPSPVCPCGQDMMETLKRIQDDIRDIKHGMGTIRTGFVRNDLGDPDYEGHRQAHLHMIQKDKNLDNLKMAGVLKLAGIGVVFVAGLTAAGFGSYIQKLAGG